MMDNIVVDLLLCLVYCIKVGNKDIIGCFQGRFIGLMFIDNSGFEVDQFDIELDDSDGKFDLFEKGVCLLFLFGWEGVGLVDKGMYKVDELEYIGLLDWFVICVCSVDMDGGFIICCEDFYVGKIVVEVVQVIVLCNKFIWLVGKKLVGQVIVYVDQIGELDVNFFLCLVKEFDVIVIVKNGMLLFIFVGELMSGLGLLLFIVSIMCVLGDMYIFSVVDWENYNGVKVYYQDMCVGVCGEVVIDVFNVVVMKEKCIIKEKKKKLEIVQVSLNLDNVKVLWYMYVLWFNVECVVWVEWQKIQRGVVMFNIMLVCGWVELFLLLYVKVSGWKLQIDGMGWLVGCVIYSLNDSGYIIVLELEIVLV